jgi:hypothetical protein
MHLSRYFSGVLFGLSASLSTSPQSINGNTPDILGSSLKQLLPRKGGGSGRGGGGSGGGRGSSGSSSHTSNVRPSFSLIRKATPSSGGGGSSRRLDSNSRFPGRWVGGGRRSDIFGTHRFGSGTSGIDLTTGVESVNFPFGFWPIWFPDDYCGTGGYEYPSSTLNDTRPGGELIVIDVQPDPAHVQVSAEEKNHTYYMIGDKDSVDIMMGILVLPKSQGGCNTLDANPANWTLSTASKDRFEPGHVIQWYRSSTFALGYTGYNNSYAYAPLNYTTPVNMSDPLPAALLTSDYLFCLNKTIGDVLPIMDADETRVLSEEEIAAIAICSVLGFIGLIICCLYRCSQYKTRNTFNCRRSKDDQSSTPNINCIEWASKGNPEGKYLHGYPTPYRESDATLVDSLSYRTSMVSKIQSNPASTPFGRPLSPTPTKASTPSSPSLGWRASLAADLPSYSKEPDERASGVSRSSFGHQYSGSLTAPVRSHLGGRGRSDRVSVSSERSTSQSGSCSPSPYGEDRRLLV